MKDIVRYYLELADNAWILSYRLSENSSKGPFLEEDLACTNVALDLIGMAESLYNKAAELEGMGRSGDDLAYRRTESEYLNNLLVEQENTDFAVLMTRQFLMDSFHYFFFTELTRSSDDFLATVANKSLKEVTYHLRRSSEWMLRFGGGTELSRTKAQDALNKLWRYTGELFTPSDADLALRSSGISVDLNKVQQQWSEKVHEILLLSTLRKPEEVVYYSKGKQGIHSEYMGYILSDMQYLNSKFPDAKWS